ncbi:MAG: hypothetical protein R3219_07130, partial [Hydrogenovibrio sp.]|nr:hypothetical protein [Hydrogenovibrio sp.]
QAVQVAPLLKYYHLGYVQHYWLPSELPTSEDFQKSLHFWRNTYAFLPKYFVQSTLSSDQKSDEESSIGEIGTFYAFGELAAKIIVNMTTKQRPELSSELGEVRMTDGKDPQIQPGLYWLNKGISPARLSQ